MGTHIFNRSGVAVAFLKTQLIVDLPKISLKCRHALTVRARKKTP